MKTTITRKIGSNRNAPRLWLEGKILAALNWKRGDRFDAKFRDGEIVYERAEHGRRAVAGDDDRPIIDTNSKRIREAIPAGSKVKVRILRDRIVITAASIFMALAGMAPLRLSEGPSVATFARKSQKVLVACEYSGAVRDAFRARGHFALSCDLLASDAPGPHYTGDALEALHGGEWDLLLAFPPCTYLASSGIWRNNPKHDPSGRRQALTEEALAFVTTLLEAPVDRVAIENPVGIISTRIRKPDQIIQPWQYGHAESKRTCLWLRGLEALRPTEILDVETHGAGGRWLNQTPSGQSNVGQTADRWKKRSKTYAGIAAAMASQWG